MELNNHYAESDSFCTQDTTKNMELCHAIVSGMPVFEGTGIKTKNGKVRAHFTRMLFDLCDQVYLGCYAIGEPFKISALKLCTVASDLILSKETAAKDKLKNWYPNMKPIGLCGWIDEILDKHEDAREPIEFKWM